MALEVMGIARCHRCNVISLPLRPIMSDPTHAAITLPSDWQAVRWFGDYPDDCEDFVLCPECGKEAWNWLDDKVVRKSTREEEQARYDFVQTGNLFATVADCGSLHHWNDSFISTKKDRVVRQRQYCRQCGVTYKSWAGEPDVS